MVAILYDYYVEKVGIGPPVLFLPGGGLSGNAGLNIADYIKDDYETHMLDLPGLGRSAGIEGKANAAKMAAWVKEYLDQQNIEQADLIGHSLGGAVLLAFAVHYPERVGKLVLLDQGHKSFPKIPTSEFGPFAYAFPLLNVSARIFGDSILNRIAPLFEAEGKEVDIDEQVERFCEKVAIEQNEYVRAALRTPVDFSVSGLRLMFGFYNLDMPHLMKQLEVPTFLCYGTFTGIHDQEAEATSLAIQQLSHHALPVRYRPVESGHYVHWSDPDLLDEIETFLKGGSV